MAPLSTSAQTSRLSILRLIGSVTIVLGEDLDPETFFRTRDLFVSDEFLNRVVPKARRVPAGTTFTVDIAVIGREAADGVTDQEIKSALPSNYLFDETQLCAVIAGLIAMRSWGEADTWWKNMYSNFLYTDSGVASIMWAEGRGRSRHVDLWEYNDRKRRPGCRVLKLAG